jgi:peptidylprolyl isomerase
MSNLVRALLRGGPALLALGAATAITLAGCSSGSRGPHAGSTPASSQGSSSASTISGSTDAPVVAKTGIKVTGAFDNKPTVTLPAGQPPKRLTEQTLVAGSGTPIASGDTVITNYVGEIWPARAKAQPKVFDSSFSRGAPAGFVIGTGEVIPGFDKTLVGKRIGSRMLLSIPPADGYGPSGNSQAGITGSDTLVFVIDLLTDYRPDASAPGVTDSQLPPTGWPKITSTPAHQPQVTSVAGVQAPASPVSKLLVRGIGTKIDPSKSLVLQVVETDIPTGKSTVTTWGKQPELVSAQNVLSVVGALSGQNIGARAVALVPATPAQPASATAAAQPATPASVLLVDVVGQF